MKLDVNNKDIILLTRKLEKMNPVTLNNVTRRTLNDMVFDNKGMGGKEGTLAKVMKKRTTFNRANPSFYRKITGVTKAQRTQNVNRMHSVSGIKSDVARLDATAEGLRDYDSGGRVRRDFNIVNEQRIGKSRGGRMTSKGKAAQKFINKNLNNSGAFVDGNKIRTKGSKFILGAKKAHEQNKLLKWTKGGNTLFLKVTAFGRTKTKGKPFIIKTEAVALEDEGRIVNIKPKWFVRDSGKISAAKGVSKFFPAQADFEFKKAGWK